MSEDQHQEPGKARPLRKQGEEAIGKLAQEVLTSPVVSGAISTVFETRERATRAQEVAMSALNLPSAADVERLTRRLRSISQRIEGLEDGLDRIADKIERSSGIVSLEARLGTIEDALARIEARLETVTAPNAPAAGPTEDGSPLPRSDS